MPLVRSPVFIVCQGLLRLLPFILMPKCLFAFLFGQRRHRSPYSDLVGRSERGVDGLVSGRSEPAFGRLFPSVRRFGWLLREVCFCPLFSINFWVLSDCFHWVHWFSFIAFFCFFSLGLWFLWAGLWVVRLIGLVWISFVPSCIVGAGHFVWFHWVRVVCIFMFVYVGLWVIGLIGLGFDFFFDSMLISFSGELWVDFDLA